MNWCFMPWEKWARRLVRRRFPPLPGGAGGRRADRQMIAWWEAGRGDPSFGCEMGTVSGLGNGLRWAVRVGRGRSAGFDPFGLGLEVGCGDDWGQAGAVRVYDGQFVGWVGVAGDRGEAEQQERPVG